MDRLNEAQLAALDDEQRDILDFAQRQQLRTHPATAITDLNHQVVRAFTALADARLEVARLTEDKHDALVALAVASDVAHETGEERDGLARQVAHPCWGEDEQGVSRPHAELLDRQREDIAALKAEVLSSEVPAGCSHKSLRRYRCADCDYTFCKACILEHFIVERDTTREDIRRLITACRGCGHPECDSAALLAEMEERYA